MRCTICTKAKQLVLLGICAYAGVSSCVRDDAAPFISSRAHVRGDVGGVGSWERICYHLIFVNAYSVAVRC